MIRVREGEREFILTIEEFEQLARRGELSPFAEVCLPAITGDAFVLAREFPLFTAVYDPRRLLFQRHFHIGRLPLVTGALALACIALFLFAQHLGAGVVTRETLLLLGAKARARIIDDGELWRILAANLLHRDVTHLFFNLFALVNVGTVLEGVYRRGDYVLLLLVGATATMGVSTIATHSVTVGASGIVFACLGAAVVFGIRFAALLPLRYRLYFGVVVVGYAAAMFSFGLARVSTDNWGHAGGLCAGLCMGALLEPRLLRLRESREPRRAVVLPWIAAAGIMSAVILLGPVLPALFFRFEPYRLDHFGVVIEKPSSWSKGSDPLGFLAFGNGVDALASIACARGRGRATLDDAERRFIQDELRVLERKGHIARLVVEPSMTDVVGVQATNALRIPLSFLSSDGPFLAEANIFLRGESECVLVLAHRTEASHRTVQILQTAKSRLQLVETKGQRDARNAALNRPQSVHAQLELARAHEAAGDIDKARAAFAHAGALLGDTPSDSLGVRSARVRFELRVGGNLDVALAEAERARLGDAANPAHAGLLLDVLIARGDLERARIALGAALRQFPNDPQLEAQRARMTSVGVEGRDALR